MELPRLLLVLALEGRAVKDVNLRNTSLHVLDMAHHLGVLPEVDGVVSAAVYLTEWHTLSNYTPHWESPIRNAAAALYGEFPLSHAREKLRQEYLRLVGSILSHDGYTTGSLRALP